MNFMKKIRDVVLHTRASNVRTIAFENICVANKKKKKRLPIDVPTRWSSTYKMLETAIKFQKEIQSYCEQQELENIEKEDWRKL